jgi:hypothetical protein
MSSGGGQHGQLTPGEAPPPDAALLAALGEMKPVPTRSPIRSLAALAGGAAALAAGVLAVKGLRADLGSLPVAWVITVALAWIGALMSVLIAVALPRRGEVLPDTARAARAALLVTAGLILLGLVATVDAPGATIIPHPTLAAFARSWWHCTKVSLLLTAPFLLLGGLVLRRLFPLGGLRAAAALGAAGGAMAGLTLHLNCPVGGGLHVGLAHAGGVALGALLGVLVLPRLLRSS